MVFIQISAADKGVCGVRSVECGLRRGEGCCFVLFFFCGFVLFLNFVVLVGYCWGRGAVW